MNKSPKQQPTKQHLCGNLPSISKTIQIRQKDMQDAAEEVKTNPYALFSYRPLHTDMQEFDVKLEPLCNKSVWT